MNAEKQKRTSNPGLPPRVDHERVIGSRREVMYNMQKMSKRISDQSVSNARIKDCG